ncbi:MAG: gluconokinase [Spirochaetota bacterium]
MKMLVMGVSGSGKSSFGQALADQLRVPFFDADDYHSPQAIAQMANGQPLGDADRWPWLERLGRLLCEHEALILGCSALKKSYRQLLRGFVPELKMCYLQGDFATVRQRLKARGSGHFFTGEAMLRSQFAALEEPEDDEKPLVISIRQSIPEQVFFACTQF